MRKIQRTNRFKKDYRRMLKRGVDEQRFQQVIRCLVHDQPLPEQCRPHLLSGDWQGFWECHIAPDWLLIYGLTDDTLILARTGTHADLFR